MEEHADQHREHEQRHLQLWVTTHRRALFAGAAAALAGVAALAARRDD